jgi:hypothetical protein
MRAVDMHCIYLVEELLEETPQLASHAWDVVGTAGCPGGPSNYVYVVDTYL